jgi:hypothetical protein
MEWVPDLNGECITVLIKKTDRYDLTQSQVLIISYDLLQSMQEFLNRIDWNIVIADGKAGIDKYEFDDRVSLHQKSNGKKVASSFGACIPSATCHIAFRVNHYKALKQLPYIAIINTRNT